MNKALKQHIDIIEQNFSQLQSRYSVKKIAIFGSTVKGKQTRKSDIDIMVEFSKPVGFFTFLKLEQYLTKLLGKKVDLVTKKALKPVVKKIILKEAVYV